MDAPLSVSGNCYAEDLTEEQDKMELVEQSIGSKS